MKQSALLAALLLSACTGCRLWNADALPMRQTLSVDMLDAMRQQLSRDAWQANREWRVTELEFQNLNDEEAWSATHWVYGSRVLDDVISRLDSAVQDSAAGEAVEERSVGASLPPGRSDTAEAEREPGASQWDGFWPLNVGQVLDSLDGGIAANGGAAGVGTKYLRQLAREETLSGWNAAILLAQRDVDAAREFLPVLERIVSSYPRHRTDAEQIRPGSESTLDEETSQAEESIDELIDRAAEQLRAASKEDGTESTNSDNSNSKSRYDQLVEKVVDHMQSISPREQARETADELERVSDSMRAAAAEAWCRVLASGAGDPQQQLAPAGRLLERGDLPNLVRGELFRGVAGEIPPSLIPRLPNAFRIGEKGDRVPLEVRRAALESCVIHAFVRIRQTGAKPSGTRRPEASELVYDPALWPETILNCQTDDDAAIRRGFGRWAAAVHYSGPLHNAVEILDAQLRDQNAQVRLAAVASFGWLGTESARTKLLWEAARPEAVVRAAAVNGLSRWGNAELAVFADDDSPTVRQAVAGRLVPEPTVKTYFLMQDLLGDRDLQVQQTAVATLAEWPDDPALKLLLVALRDGSGPTRKAAYQQLRQRRTVTAPFAMFDSLKQEERRVTAEELGRSLGISPGFEREMRELPVNVPRAASPQLVREVDMLMRDVTDRNLPSSSPRRAESASRLMQLQPDDVPVVEEYLLQHPEAEATFAYAELLPQLSVVHAALNELDRADLEARRSAARRLLDAAASGSLSRLQIRRLLPHLDYRQDVLVWRDAMAAVMPDATDEHAQAALRALNDERADVRLLGCDYLQRHARPQFADWIHRLRLLEDRDKRVRIAAIQAAGRCGNPRILEDRIQSGDATGGRTAADRRHAGLRSLLTHSDAETRMEAVISMARLGDRQGMHELSRLSWSQEPAIRVHAVEEMGKSGSTWFVERLIQRGWIEEHADVRRAILNSLEQLTLPGKRPLIPVDATGYDDKIRLWLEWWEAGQRQLTTRDTTHAE